jgi:hypothetical protein
VFYSSIICERDKIEEIIDARTSDASHLHYDLMHLFYVQKHSRQSGIYLKANSQETDKDSQEIDDILSNPETLEMKKKATKAVILSIAFRN